MGIFDWMQAQWNATHGNQQNQAGNYQGYVTPGQDAMMQQDLLMQQQLTGQVPYAPNAYGTYGEMPGMYTGRTVTKKMLLDYIVTSLGAVEVVQCDEFETQNTRHICAGTTRIQILPVNIFNVPTPNGVVPVEVIWCPNCRKLIVNRSTLELI